MYFFYFMFFLFIGYLLNDYFFFTVKIFLFLYIFHNTI